MSQKLTLAAIALLSLLVARSYAEEAVAPATAHKMIGPADLVWGEGPPGLPPGPKMAVLYGDPGKPGLFIIRVKTPANYKIPAHWHPTDESVTVISGTLLMGMGDKLDAKLAKPIAAGGFAMMPAKSHHFALTEAETQIQVTAMGPFAITYINPNDDPTQAATTRGAPAKK